MCMCYILPKKFKRTLVVFIWEELKSQIFFDDVLGVNKSNYDIVVIILQIDLGKKSNLMTNKEQANYLEGANGKNISNCRPHSI